MRTANLSRESKPISQPILLNLNKPSSEGVRLGDFTVLGRDSDCQIHLTDAYVSVRHARIIRRNNRFLLIDLKSRNGTYVNGQRVGEIDLQDQDRIEIGQTQFMFLQAETLLIPESPLLRSQNSKYSKTLSQLPALAQTSLSIVVLGPSGAGKDVIAHAIHSLSPRSEGPFVSINCSALTDSLVESELFGHRKGSFTGAIDDHRGAFAQAHHGTLFLDEIGDLPLHIQPKLLRAVENCEIRPVGGDGIQKVDVRLICATHKSLARLVQDGLFRRDLYYRLNTIEVQLPALKDRPEDLEHLIFQFAREFRVCLSVSAINALKNHDWPGNIRELKNSIAKASALFVGKRVEEQDIPSLLVASPGKNNIGLPGSDGRPQKMRDIERLLIERQLLLNRGNQRRTALALGIPKSTLHDKVKQYHIDVDKLKDIDPTVWL